MTTVLGRMPRVVVTALALQAVAGCAAKRASVVPGAPASATIGSQAAPERLIARRASITVRVADVSAAIAKVEPIVTGMAGAVAESSRTDGGGAYFMVRVPAARLEETLDRLAALGRARERTVTERDVTDQAFDLDARLRNKVALRDRLRALVTSTASLQDVVALEEQLSRLQADIETLEGQVKRLRSEIEMSTISLALERETQLGPVGLVLHGLWLGVRQLFVWR